MSRKFGFYSDKSPPSIPFENHLTGLQQQTKALLLDLRIFVKSLGDDIIEEVRPHRIVYAKSLTFRTFLDIQPRNDYIIISMRKGRIESSNITQTIKDTEELNGIKHQITEVYKMVK